MIVRMLNCMRVGYAIMRVRNGMRVSMMMLLCQRIDHNDHRSNNHYSKTDKIGPKRFFFKDKKR